jgi:hypothetical protein
MSEVWPPIWLGGCLTLLVSRDARADIGDRRTQDREHSAALRATTSAAVVGEARHHDTKVSALANELRDIAQIKSSVPKSCSGSLCAA